MSLEEGYVTLDETGVTDNSQDNDPSSSLNSSSKRKVADLAEIVDCYDDSPKPRKRKCQQQKVSTNQQTSAPLITVSFASRAVARRYAVEIGQYIAELIGCSEEPLVREDDATSELLFFSSPEQQQQLEDGVDGQVDEGLDDVVEVCSDDPEVVAVEDEYVEPEPVDVIPQYEQTFSSFVGAAADEKETEEGGEEKKRGICFNCDGDHMIADCPKPRDSSRIAQRRRERQTANPFGNTSRYHDDSEARFGHLKPGRLSQDLRDALGLRHFQLPQHIYKMRLLGYPPGWLRAARNVRSNLAVLHDPKPGGSETHTEGEEEVYDLSKLVRFPGFNCSAPSGVRDEHHRLGYPRQDHRQSLRQMERELPTRRRRPAPAPRTQRAAAAPPAPAEDMDTAEDDVIGVRTVSRSSPDDGELPDSQETSREGSPSLQALEEQRRVLLSSLEAEPEEEEDQGEEAEEAPLVRAPPQPVAVSTPVAPLVPGASRQVDLGTPVGGGALSRLPEADKWAAGISEHIPHENLPGATGAWKRMSGLMERIRSKVKELSGGQ